MNEQQLAVQTKIKETTTELKSSGGFRILEGSVAGSKGIRDMNPKNEAKRAIFLTDEKKAGKRKELKAELELLKSLIEEGSIEDAIAKSREQSKKATEALNTNLKAALDNSRDLEASYRSMELFYRNADEEGMRNVYFINMPSQDLAKNVSLRKDVEDHFDAMFDRFSLENNYSYLVMPGFLGDDLDTFSKMAKKFRVTLLTDYEDKESVEDVEDQIEDQKLAGEDEYKSNTIVTCNYGVVRKKYDGVEDDHLFIPLSVPLAGKMYNGNGIQPPAGKKHGKLDGVMGVRMDLRRRDVDKIDSMGMVPIIYENAWGTVAMSDITLCAESDNPDLKALGVVKSKDWIAKVLLDYFNGLTFQTYNGRLKNEIEEQLTKFFRKITGPGKLLESFSIDGPMKDPDNPQAVRIGINVKPYFATKHFIVNFSGTQGEFGEND